MTNFERLASVVGVEIRRAMTSTGKYRVNSSGAEELENAK